MASRWAWLVLVVQLVRCSEHADDKKSEPSWSYKCLSEGCQRTQPLNEAELSTTTAYENVELCRTVCGRFGGLWPKPVSVSLSKQMVKIHPNYIRYDLHDVPAEARPLLVKMTQVATSNLLAECGGNVTELVPTPVVVYISVKSSDITLTWDTIEQYAVDVKTKDGSVAVHIFADTVFGARHALETFTQLVAPDNPDFSRRGKCGLRLISGAKIIDNPVYKHRGLNLDTSRNFIPLNDIKRTLDGMAATKLNIFHWHVTDSQSFPLESKRVPQFTRYGAYSKSEIYRTEEVRELVEYALVRGIRVVIEIDAPAHAGNGWQWGKEFGLGDLAVCVNEINWRKYCVEAPCGQLNPANPAMYQVLKDLYRDLAEVLPKPALFHMGGDEVIGLYEFDCTTKYYRDISIWFIAGSPSPNSSAEIVNYMKTKGFELDGDGFMQLWAEFHARALYAWDDQLKEATGVDKQPVIIWSSQLTDPFRIRRNLDKDRYVIEVWEPVESPLLHELLRLGYRVISCPKNVWYLDHGFWGNTLYSNWRRMYVHTLPSGPGVLGGEVSMWAELVDGFNLDTRTWPRAAAVGERLWSDPKSGAYAAEPRMNRMRARLIARGLRADAVAPAWCTQNDGQCY